MTDNARQRKMDGHGNHQPFTGGKLNKGVILRLTRYMLKKYKVSLAMVCLCILVYSVTSIVATLFLRTLIDDYIVPLTQVANPEFASLAQTLFKLALILVIGTTCGYLYNLIMVRISQGTMFRLRKDLFSHMETLPIGYFDSRQHGEIMSVYTNDVDTLRQMIGQSLPEILSSLISLSVTFCSMVVLSVPLTFVSLVMAAVMMACTFWLGMKSRTYFMTQQEKLAEVNGYIEEMVGGQKVVKVFCHEAEAIRHFEEINRQLCHSNYNANKIANIVMPVNGNLGNVAYVLIAVIGAALALAGFTGLSLGTIVSFLTLNRNFSMPLAQVSMQVNSIINASVGAERVFAMLDAKPEEDLGTTVLETCADGRLAWVRNDGTKRVMEGDVDFCHVDFGYVEGKQILHDICIDPHAGQKIAFVGGTGAGKTTVINLITRFYDVWRGTITFDGIPVSEIRKRDLRRVLGMVPQDTHLFSGTVMDNIRYGRLDATDRECMDAAEAVGADGFIRRLTDGYDTMLHGDGNNLSQGERQLVAIARVVLGNPPVLILDEATSSVDTHTELMVQRGMAALMQGRTVFVIAHRLSTIRNADCIMVMEQGRIVEHGTHQQLMELQGRYYRLNRQ